MSASDNALALRAIEERGLGISGRGVRRGRMSLHPWESHIIPQFAVIDDASARPIAADTAYDASLVNFEGTKIAGSSFKVWEVTQNRTVPDAEPIEVFPVQGVWGFLWRVKVINFVGSCMIDEDNDTTKNPGATSMEVNGNNGNDADLALNPGKEQRLLLKLARGPLVGSSTWPKAFIYAQVAHLINCDSWGAGDYAAEFAIDWITTQFYVADNGGEVCATWDSMHDPGNYTEGTTQQMMLDINAGADPWEYTSNPYYPNANWRAIVDAPTGAIAEIFGIQIRAIHWYTTGIGGVKVTDGWTKVKVPTAVDTYSHLLHTGA